MTIKWISSAGGPLVLCTESAVKAWTGVDGDDYELACAQEGYLGAVVRHGHHYLIVADEPLETTVLTTEAGIVVAQWTYCDSDARAEELLNSLPSELPRLAPDVEFEMTEVGAVLFDSAAAGEWVEELLPIPLQKGRYWIATENYEGPGYQFVIFRFKAKTAVSGTA